jgi:Mg2+ and Co2+ transporter CorA
MMTVRSGNDIRRIIMREVNQKADLMYLDDNTSDVIEGLVDGVTDAIVTVMNQTRDDVAKAFREIEKKLQ